MSNEPSIPSSVDTSGTISRQSRLTRDAAHLRDVGEPLAARAYRANVSPRHDGEGVNSNPLKCAIVLGTVNDAGTVEYRIGRFKNSHHLHLGLSVPVRHSEDESPFALRSDVVQNCFGDSTIFSDRAEAILAADNKFLDNNGIKVITTPYKFPLYSIR